MNTQPTPRIDQASIQPIRCAFAAAHGFASEDRLALAKHLRRRLELLEVHWSSVLISADDVTLEQAVMSSLTFQLLADLLEEGLPPDQAATDGLPRISVLTAIEVTADLTEEQRTEIRVAMARQHQALTDLRNAMIESELMPSTAYSSLNLWMAEMANDLYDLKEALHEVAPIHVKCPEATLRINAAGEIEAFNASTFPFILADYQRPSRARALVCVSHAGRVIAEPLKPSDLVIDLDNPMQAVQAATFASPHVAAAMLRAAGARLGFDMRSVLADLITELEAESCGHHMNELPAYRNAIHLLDALGHRHTSPFAERVRSDDGLLLE